MPDPDSDDLQRTDTRTYREFALVELRAAIQLLQEIKRIAPHVREDLVKRASNCDSAFDLEEAARQWAIRWHLCDEKGPCQWAVTVAVDSAKSVPEFGWNINSLLAPAVVPDDEDQPDDSTFRISWPQGELWWNPAKESYGQFRERLFEHFAEMVDDQISAAATAHIGSGVSIRRWKDTHVVTWLVRHIAWGESFTDIGSDPRKYRSRSATYTSKSSGIRRDVEGFAAEVGIVLQKGQRGRPKGRGDKVAGARRVAH